jgi:hypothetical protein
MTDATLNTPTASIRRATRHVHLVGSTPFESTDEALDIALRRLGARLRTLPDGETGARRDWIIHIVESLRNHPDLEVTREGTWGDYDDTLTFRVRPGHTLRGETLDFGHVADVEDSYPRFVDQRAGRGIPLDDLRFQVGIPGDFDMALFTLGPRAAFLGRRPFTDAAVDEIRRIRAIASDDVVFQLEVPAELVLVARTPAPLQSLIAMLLARGLRNVAKQSPRDTRFGIHLCVGDMNHRALGRMRDVRPLVLLANAIARAWPASRPLEFIHAPFAAAIEPPPLDAAFYAPLKDLRLPASTRFIAGVVHEQRSLDEERELLSLIDGLTGRQVDVATACGLGRRDREAALATIDQAAALCEEVTPRGF